MRRAQPRRAQSARAHARAADARRPPRVALRRRAAAAARLLSRDRRRLRARSHHRRARARSRDSGRRHVVAERPVRGRRRTTIRTTGSRFDRRRWVPPAPERLWGAAGARPRRRRRRDALRPLHADGAARARGLGLLRARARAARSSRSGAIRWPDGRLPVNTHGGQLSEAFIHGYNNLTEAVRQLRGTSTCQVPDAEVVFVAAASSDPYGALLLSVSDDAPCCHRCPRPGPTRASSGTAAAATSCACSAAPAARGARFAPRPGVSLVRLAPLRAGSRRAAGRRLSPGRWCTARRCRRSRRSCPTRRASSSSRRAPFMVGQIRGCDPRALRADLPVRVEFDDVADDVSLPHWRVGMTRDRRRHRSHAVHRTAPTSARPRWPRAAIPPPLDDARHRVGGRRRRRALRPRGAVGVRPPRRAARAPRSTTTAPSPTRRAAARRWSAGGDGGDAGAGEGRRRLPRAQRAASRAAGRGGGRRAAAPRSKPAGAAGGLRLRGARRRARGRAAAGAHARLDAGRRPERRAPPRRLAGEPTRRRGAARRPRRCSTTPSLEPATSTSRACYAHPPRSSSSALQDYGLAGRDGGRGSTRTPAARTAHGTVDGLDDLLEAVRQLRGDGRRQVPGARVALVAGSPLEPTSSVLLGVPG